MICTHDNPQGHEPGGVFNIPITTPENFYVKLTKDLWKIKKLAFSAVTGRGKREKILQKAATKRTEDQQGEPEMSDPSLDKLYAIKRLPPITLTFAYPHSYPSASPPTFTLSCCWLEKKHLTQLCEKLDELWMQHKGSPVISVWHDFLYNDVISYLDLKSPYDLGRVYVHIFTHPRDRQYKAMLQPRPLDDRGIQNFSNLDDVLLKVLDFNIVTCDICFEEKPGDQFLRLINCDIHQQCKLCLKGWTESLIKDGVVFALKCPGHKCDKDLLPTEIAAVVSKELYDRYDSLLLKTAFDVMPDVIHCPRSFCGFPVVLEDNLGLCQKCHHAFCGRCQNTYHGHSPCKLKSEMINKLCEDYEAASDSRRLELEMRYGKQVIKRALEETRSSKWLESNSKQCPCCSTFIQKNDGCNKMTCTNCRTFFCWLCQQELSRSNPYAHYQHPTSFCANRLFEGVLITDDAFLDMLDEGDESDDESDNDVDHV
jgi:E3 ubiquitin-protein ligase RNF14